MDELMGRVPEHWTKTSLGDVADVQAGHSNLRPYFLPLGAAGVGVVAASQVGRHGRVSDFSARRVPDHVAASMTRFRLREDDLVCVRSGEVARAALVGPGQDGWLVGTSCLRVRVRNGDRVSPRYLLHYLAHEEVRAWLVARSSRSVISNLRTRTALDLPVLLPPPAEQRAIVEVLAALERKEEAHRRVAEETGKLRTSLADRLLTGTMHVTDG
ncbi:hypothetical protein [Actinocorallia sp. A-T 12471]|uniref:hypothetical protein n=1 Tax=Actinocorallia sp. A-T 12471 TaxID=3089813 RepID=UPI0029CCAA9E|nr:hypothetical protein [Actinocorallia sp. A-T 12471]MDX6743045.1 hypothetical protein [Actinocorallia sp. A-T 12471]